MESWRSDQRNGYHSEITVSENTFPNGVTIEWSWPGETEDNDFFYAYPERTIGQKPLLQLPTSFDNFPVEVSNIVNLDLNYDIDWTQAEDSGFFIAVSLWLSNDPDGGVRLPKTKLWFGLNPRMPTLPG